MHAQCVRDWVDRRRGGGCFHRAATQYDPDWPEQIDATRWHELWPMLRVLEDSLGPERAVEPVVVEVTRPAADRHLDLLCEGLERFRSPCRALVRAKWLLRALVGFGELEELVNVPGRYEARVDGVPRDAGPWFRGLCLGLMPAALRRVGARSARARCTGQRGSDEHLSLRFRCDYTL